VDRENGGEGKRKGRGRIGPLSQMPGSALVNIGLFCNFLLFIVRSRQAYCDLLKFFSYALVYIMICCSIIPLLFCSCGIRVCSWPTSTGYPKLIMRLCRVLSSYF